MSEPDEQSPFDRIRASIDALVAEERGKCPTCLHPVVDHAVDPSDYAIVCDGALGCRCRDWKLLSP